MMMIMNELYEKAMKANVARTEISGEFNTKWTPDAIKIYEERDEEKMIPPTPKHSDLRKPRLYEGNRAPTVPKKRNWWRVAFFIAIGLSIFENFLK
jgi:hypothetical protein